MDESKPRDLTQEELALVRSASSTAGGTEPLRIPPGTQIAVESLNPAGTYDLEKVTPPIELRIGTPGESYKGIGKDLINIESLPVFADSAGPFGSPTSDSERAMVRLETRKVLMVVFSFTGPEGLEYWVSRASETSSPVLRR